jgi:hypothetical protein
MKIRSKLALTAVCFSFVIMFILSSCGSSDRTNDRPASIKQVPELVGGSINNFPESYFSGSAAIEISTYLKNNNTWVISGTFGKNRLKSYNILPSTDKFVKTRSWVDPLQIIKVPNYGYGVLVQTQGLANSGEVGLFWIKNLSIQPAYLASTDQMQYVSTGGIMYFGASVMHGAALMCNWSPVFSLNEYSWEITGSGSFPPKENIKVTYQKFTLNGAGELVEDVLPALEVPYNTALENYSGLYC